MTRSLRIIGLSVCLAAVCAGPAAAQNAVQNFVAENRGKVVFVQAFPNENRLPTDVLAAGSGVLLKDGYVLTARHIAKAGKLTGTPEQGERLIVLDGRIGSDQADGYLLEYIGESEKHDLLLLRFDRDVYEGRDHACLRDPGRPVEYEEKIRVLGFPQAATVTGGTPRKRHRIAVGGGMITSIGTSQFDTSMTITYGHSGAPIFDADGAVIAIAKGELKSGGEATDISVLVPVERAESILPAIVRNARCNSTRGAAVSPEISFVCTTRLDQCNLDQQMLLGSRCWCSGPHYLERGIVTR